MNMTVFAAGSRGKCLYGKIHIQVVWCLSRDPRVQPLCNVTWDKSWLCARTGRFVRSYWLIVLNAAKKNSRGHVLSWSMATHILCYSMLYVIAFALSRVIVLCIVVNSLSVDTRTVYQTSASEFNALAVSGGKWFWVILVLVISLEGTWNEHKDEVFIFAGSQISAHGSKCVDKELALFLHIKQFPGVFTVARTANNKQCTYRDLPAGEVQLWQFDIWRESSCLF